MLQVSGSGVLLHLEKGMQITQPLSSGAMLQDAINLRKWGKNDMLLAKRRLHQFAHAPMNWADIRRAVEVRYARCFSCSLNDCREVTVAAK